VTVREEEELEQTLEAAQADEEDENSEEWLITFSQEAEGEDEHSKEWLNIFSQDAEEAATWEFAVEEGQEVNNICFADLWQ
jgi:hypothetical protein